MSHPHDPSNPARRSLASVSLVTKIASLFFMTFVVVLGATGLFWGFLHHTSDDLRVVEELSQQAKLSIRIVSLAEDVSDDTPVSMRQLVTVANSFDNRLPDVVERTDELTRVPSDIVNDYPPVSQAWDRLYYHIEILTDPDASTDAREFSRAYILQHGPQLTETFERATSAYRDRSEQLRSTVGSILLGAVFINVVLLVTGTIWTRRRIVTPLRRLEQATMNLRRGDLESRVGPRTTDELGSLEEAFNEMATEMEQLVDALDEERRFAQSLVAHAPAAVVVHHHDQVRFVNPEFCRIFDLDSITDIPQGKLTHLFRPRDRDLANRVINDLEIRDTNEAPTPRELHLTEREDGEERSVEVISVPLDYAGERAVLSVMNDISEKKKLTARMMQMDRVIAIGTLVAGVGHEINNPLSFIAGNLEFTLTELEELRQSLNDGEPLSPSQVHYAVGHLQDALQSASEGTERIADIVTQLRTFSRRDEAPRQPINIREPLESAINMAVGEIRHRAHLIRHFDDVPAVRANPSQLAQVFLNLLINAAHSIDEGKAQQNTITVRLFTDGGDVAVEIEDTGSGIDNDDADRIFDPFYTTKPPGQGTGLGLSICQQLVEAHHGIITFDTTPGEGTTFRVSLPITDEAVPRTEEATWRRLRSDATYTVAVIDDEPLVGEIFERNLSGDHDVFTWRDPTRFLQALDQGADFDVIFCDLMMPNLTGREIYDLIECNHPHLLSRLIFITGGAFTPRARAFIRTVDPPLLEKPFDFHDVRELIRKIVDN